MNPAQRDIKSQRVLTVFAPDRERFAVRARGNSRMRAFTSGDRLRANRQAAAGSDIPRFASY